MGSVVNIWDEHDMIILSSPTGGGAYAIDLQHLHIIRAKERNESRLDAARKSPAMPRKTAKLF